MQNVQTKEKNQRSLIIKYSNFDCHERDSKNLVRTVAIKIISRATSVIKKYCIKETFCIKTVYVTQSIHLG